MMTYFKFKVVNAENTGKGFGFVRIENDRGFGALNQLVTNLNSCPFKGRRLKVELRLVDTLLGEILLTFVSFCLSEDLSREEKAKRRAEQDAAWEAELAAWEATPPELREAPGYSGIPFPEAGGSRGRGRGGLGSSWPQNAHANKMTRGGRGAPGGLLAAAASRGGRGGLGRAYPYPSRPGTQPALEYDGSEEKDESEVSYHQKLNT